LIAEARPLQVHGLERREGLGVIVGGCSLLSSQRYLVPVNGDVPVVRNR
jgi:hypothetical protein